MVLNENSLSRDTDGFAQEGRGGFGVVEGINQHDRIHAALWFWNSVSVKLDDGDRCVRADEYVNTFEG